MKVNVYVKHLFEGYKVAISYGDDKKVVDFYPYLNEKEFRKKLKSLPKRAIVYYKKVA